MSSCLFPLSTSPLSFLGLMSRGSIPGACVPEYAGTTTNKRKGSENVGSFWGAFQDKCIRLRDLRGSVQVNIILIIGLTSIASSSRTSPLPLWAPGLELSVSGVRNFFQRAPFHVLTDLLSNFFRQKGVTNCNG